MKIIIVISNINNSGGTEKASISLANSLSKTHNVKVLSVNTKQYTEPFFVISKNVEVLHLKSTNDLMKFFEIRSILHEKNPDIILNTGHKYSCLSFFFRNKRAKIFAIEHIDFYSIPKLSKVFIRLIYWTLDGIVVLSNDAKLKVKSYNKNIYVIPNQINISEKSSDLSSCEILMVGRLSREKAYERIIPISKFILDKFPNWKINIYGSGDLDYKNYLLTIFEKNNCKNVFLFEAVKNIEDKYVNSSIFLITSKNEAMPMVILEAKSFGLPIVGIANEGVNNLVEDKVDGFIVRDSLEAAERIAELISNNILKNEMGKNAKQNVFKYSEDRVLKLWENIFYNE